MSDEPGDFVAIQRLRWPSEIQRAEDILESMGIRFEIVELFDGEEWELLVPREAAAPALEALAGEG